MKKSPEQMMEELYKFYNEQCPHEKINHGGYSEEKTEGFIILESGTEIVHFSNYQGGYAIKFLFVRGTDEVFFDTYLDAFKHDDMNEEEFEFYLQSITL